MLDIGECAEALDDLPRQTNLPINVIFTAGGMDLLLLLMQMNIYLRAALLRRYIALEITSALMQKIRPMLVMLLSHSRSQFAIV